MCSERGRFTDLFLEYSHSLIHAHTHSLIHAHQCRVMGVNTEMKIKKQFIYPPFYMSDMKKFILLDVLNCD